MKNEHRIKERLSSAKECWTNESRLIKDIWTERYPGKKWPTEREHASRLRRLEKIVMIFLVWVRRFYQSFKAFIFKQTEPDIADWYVPTTLVVLVLLLLLPIWKPLSSIIAFFIILDVLNYSLCIAFVDRYRGDWKPRSFNRSLILLFINYLQIIVGFASFYLWPRSIGLSNCTNTISSPWEALYFSTVTITTLGYGDIRPICNWGRFLVMLETLSGITILVLIIGIFFIEMSKKDQTGYSN